MTKAHITFLVIMLNGRIDRARKDERGVSAVEWVVISAMLVAIAVALYAVISGKISDKAESIDLDEGL